MKSVNKEDLFYNLKYSMNCFSEIKDILSQIKHINYAVIKGEILSLLAYKKLGYRKYNDIDILIDKNDIAYLEEILKNNGWLSDIKSESRAERVFYISNSHQLWNYYKEINNIKVVIDINFDVFWGGYTGDKINIVEFLCDTQDIYIFNTHIKTLSYMKMMIQLILHCYKDLNSIFILATRNSIKYSMFEDIYWFFKNNEKYLPLNDFFELVCKYKVESYIFYVLYYTNLVFNDDELQKYTAHFRTEEGEQLLNCYGLAENEKKVWKKNFSERLNSDNIYNIIKGDLTENDINKININSKIFI